MRSFPIAIPIAIPTAQRDCPEPTDHAGLRVPSTCGTKEGSRNEGCALSSETDIPVVVPAEPAEPATAASAAGTPEAAPVWTGRALLEIREYGAMWELGELEPSLGFAFDLGQLFCKRPEATLLFPTGPMGLSLREDFDVWLETIESLGEQLRGFSLPALAKAGRGAVAHFHWQERKVELAGPKRKLVLQAAKIFADATETEPRGYTWLRGAVLPDDDDPDGAALTCVEAAAQLLSRYGRINKDGALSTPALMMVDGRLADLSLEPPLDPAGLREQLLEAWDAANGELELIGLFSASGRATLRPREGDFTLRSMQPGGLESRALLLRPWLREE